MPLFHRRLVPVLSVLTATLVSNSKLRAVDRERPPAEQVLLGLYPGLRTHHAPTGEVAFYGRAMNGAVTADLAAKDWIANHADAFGVANLDLRLIGRVEMAGSRVVYSYEQYLDGLPVENMPARLVSQRALRHSIVYAAGRFASPPVGGFAPITLSAIRASASVRLMPEYAHLANWSKPELVVYSTENGPLAPPIRAWKFHADRAPGADYDAYTFFVDAANGKLAHARREVYFQQVTGRVRGLGSPGVLPDTPTNPPVPLNLPQLAVSTIDADTLTASDGTFTLPNAGESSVTVTADLVGPWAKVLNQQGDDLHIEQSISPSIPGDLVFNLTPSEFTTAQVNAFIHINQAHDFYKAHQPDFTGTDRQMPTRVNLDSTCNAFFSPIDLSFNFYHAGGCVNTAYSMVIDHEFGHFIVNRHRLRQEAFGEGYGDSLAMLMWNDPMIGRDFLGPGNPVRDLVAADKQYPCQGEVHECGQVLGGSWWEVKQALAASLGEEPGLNLARQLFTDWTEITIGVPFGPNSATPQTAIEVLTADDDDADLNNGTPHQAEICAGFAEHSIPCPGVCEGVRRFRVTCRDTTGLLTASAVTGDAPGTDVSFRLDESLSAVGQVSSRGRVRVQFEAVPVGFHKVCIDGCPGVCKTVGCAP